jgi:hypothetical protein
MSQPVSTTSRPKGTEGPGGEREAERPAPPTLDDMARDCATALTFADYGIPTGQAADQLRARLRGYIQDHLAEPGRKYAGSLTDERAREIAESTVEHALRVASDRGGNAQSNLRLLAKAVGLLMRYTAPRSER